VPDHTAYALAGYRIQVIGYNTQQIRMVIKALRWFWKNTIRNTITKHSQAPCYQLGGGAEGRSWSSGAADEVGERSAGSATEPFEAVDREAQPRGLCSGQWCMVCSKQRLRAVASGRLLATPGMPLGQCSAAHRMQCSAISTTRLVRNRALAAASTGP
jgi:hypothetical protein